MKFSNLKRFGQWFILIVVLYMTVGCVDTDSASDSENGYFKWVRDESSLVDVIVLDGKAQIYYSFCFENGYDKDVIINHIFVDLRRLDLFGWLQYEESFCAIPVDYENGVVFPSKSKMYVTYVIEGEYLGGKINDNIKVSNMVFLMDWQ